MATTTPSPTQAPATVLRRASPEQRLQALALRASHWARNLSHGAYISFCRDIDASAACSGNKLVAWVLVREGEEDGLDLLAVADTVSQACLRSLPSNADTTAIPITSYTVRSVYTPPAYRGKGYARTLLSRLHNELTSSEMCGGVSTLYSDVGPFYEGCGRGWWLTSNRAWETRWDVDHILGGAIVLPKTLATPFGQDEVSAVSETDCALIRKEIVTPSLTGHKAKFVVLPMHAEYQFFFTRAKHLFQPPHCDFIAPQIVGGKIGDAFAVWTFLPRRSELQLLRLRASSEAQLAALLLLAAETGKTVGCKTIVGWNVRDGWEVVGKGERKERTGIDVPAFAWYAGKEEESEVEWMCCERFCSS